MTSLRTAGVLVACVVLSLTTLAASAKPLPPKVRQTSSPIAALAMDGSRVVYASGGKVYVWNVETGTTSVVKGVYSKNPAEVAIAGTRVAWISRFVIGNSYQTTERLYTAPAGGTARQLRVSNRSHGEGIGEWYGSWTAGAVGSAQVLAVSTWTSHGTASSTERLNQVTASGLKPIASGPGAIMAASADAGRIAVLRSSAAWPYEWSQTGPVSIGIYSSSGKLLSELKPSSAKETALTGDRLVVLTEAKTLQVYAWKTGTLTKTWKVVTGTPRLQAGHLAAYGTLATYSVDPRSSDARSVHVLSLTTGKDVVVGTGRSGSLGYYGRDATLGPRGLVYSVTFHEHHKLGTPQHGKLVFVPTAKLLAAFAGGKQTVAAAAAVTRRPAPHTLVTAPKQMVAFAQSSQALAWTDSAGRVRMQRLPAGKSTIVGRIDSEERAYGSSLTISGSRVLWAWDSGGNSNETSVMVGGLGLKPAQAAFLGGGARNIGDGRHFAGLAGGSSSLAFGWVDEACPGLPFGLCEMCNPLGSCPLTIEGGGVSLVTPGVKPTAVPGITPPALFAVAEGRVAVAPARSPASPAGPLPRITEDGPVEVFDFSGRLLARIPLVGLVRGISMTGHKVTVLQERPEGDRRILRFDARTGTYLSGSPLLSPAASSLATGTGGIVFRIGRQVYLLRGGNLVPVARAASTPIGLSIEGRRVAWAENVRGQGRIRAVTIP